MHWQDPKFRWMALGVTGILLVSTLGVALLFAPRGDGRRYLEVYITDFPGDFERFQLTVSGVYVGDEAYELKLDAKEFDVLQYHGTGDSLLLAYGEVPESAQDRLSLVFTRAQAYFAGQWVPIAIPHKMLTITDGLNLGAHKDGALLLDLEMERSLVLTEKGYTFEPYVKNLYEHEFPTNAARPDDPASRGTLAKNGFTAPPTVDPGQKREDPPPPRSGPQPSSSAMSPSTQTACVGSCDEPQGGGSGPQEDEPTSDRLLPEYPQGTLNDPSNCPKGDLEMTDDQTPQAWAEMHLKREACELSWLTQQYYGDAASNMTYIGSVVQQGGPITIPTKPLAINTGLKVNSNSYQGLPIQDVPIAGLDPGLIENLPDVQLVLDPITGVLLSADEIQQAAAEIVHFGGQPLFAYSMAPAIAFQATPQQAWAISQSDLFDWVELAKEGAAIEYDTLASANLNTVLSPLRTLTSPSGLPYDGHGVGVAIIDSGVDGLHRDLPYDETGTRPAHAAILENCWLNVPKNTYGVGAIPLLDQSSLCAYGPNTDTLGHGTMVAGLLLGRPPAENAQSATLLSSATNLGVDVSNGAATASNWLYGSPNTALNLVQKGVAPQAKGYMISFAGDGANLLMATVAYDRLLYMLDHPRPGDPRILVVSNSWETTWQSTNENSLLYWQMGQVVDRGVTIVFSAGNGGGDGITPMTSPECVHPREGVVCVGAVEDNDQTNRSRVNPWFASSRGARFNPTTWPDLCAPGTRLRTAYPTTFSPNTVAGVASSGGLTAPYALFTGTSAAAPYVAGVIALLQQARKDAGLSALAPDRVEAVLEQSAFAFPNVSGGYAMSNDPRFDGSGYECGHGLVDAQRAVAFALMLP
jgi:serine protease AprX